MGKLSVKKINTNDFTSANKEDLSKLARSLNPFFDDIERIIRKGLTVQDNLPFQYLDFTVEVDSSGIPINKTQLSTNLTTTIKGLCIGNIEPISSVVYPNYMPYINYSVDGNMININIIKGLPNNIKYKFSVMVLS